MKDVIGDIVNHIRCKFYLSLTIFLVAKENLSQLSIVVNLDHLEHPEDQDHNQRVQIVGIDKVIGLLRELGKCIFAYRYQREHEAHISKVEDNSQLSAHEVKFFEKVVMQIRFLII